MSIIQMLQSKSEDGWFELKIRYFNMLLTRDSVQWARVTQTESEGIEKIFHTKKNDKKVGVAMPI